MTATRSISRLLIANRGEIAVRIAQTAKDLSIESVGIYADDDDNALHLACVDDAVALGAGGAAAYLDIENIVRIAKERHCDAIHPGYGFLAENTAFAERCLAEGIVFVGPMPETLALFGDKLAARSAASDAGVPVLASSESTVDEQRARAFLESLDGRSMIIKAVAGGGGRGMRIIRSADEIADALQRCASEAEAAFGSRELYVEALVERALHVEIQVLGDGTGAVSHLGERDCSTQRRHQKVVEVAPSPQLPPALRSRIQEAAVAVASAARYRNIGTFEFLVDAADLGEDSPFYFIEANPRVQVEHTVTEEITGVDLVAAQLGLATGQTLADLGLDQLHLPAAKGYAMQLRVNMETMRPDGTVRPSGGMLEVFEPPRGPGVRVDTCGYAGYRTSPHYDSLLAKVIVHGADFGTVAKRARRALSEFRVDGVATNLDVLQNLLMHDEFIAGRIYTDFFDDNAQALAAKRDGGGRRPGRSESPRQTVGARVDATDPLAVLNYGKRPETEDPSATPLPDDGTRPITADMQSTVIGLSVEEGDVVHRGQELMVLSAMKMEHVVHADVSGIVRHLHLEVGDTIPEGSLLLSIEPQEMDTETTEEAVEQDLETPRPDLAEVLRRRALTSDASRKAQVEKRHSRGGRTAKENVEDLCDEGTFMQFGSLAVGAGLEGSVDELLDYAPSDGLVMGLGHVNGRHFDESRSRCAAVAYDYTVLAGTQGGMNHKMMDRMFQVANRMELPIVLFSEGGGGRAGGGSRAARGGGPAITGGGGLNTPSWWILGQLSGKAPIVGINSGWCFAGNAALLGCCDVIIATANSSIGMGGPAMIEGGGLGVYRPEEVGPMSVQVPNGVVDVAVEDEAAAVAAAKQYLSYFQGRVEEWQCDDQRLLRHAIPENRLRVYDIRRLLVTFADKDSVLELRPEFGRAMVTAFARLEGRPVGIVANNPAFLSGAIDSDAADKAARFMKLCDAFDIPLVFLCDTPGIMVGPEAEKEATVRHSARMFVVGASLTVPTFMVILRKAYGLGAQAMGGGCHRVPNFVVAWPTSEFGGMGLEGQVKLGQRARLEAIEDPAERQAAFEKMVEAAYERGKGLNAAHVYEIEDVIDPADTRRWVIAGLKASPPPEPRRGKKRPCVDTW